MYPYFPLRIVWMRSGRGYLRDRGGGICIKPEFEVGHAVLDAVGEVDFDALLVDA